MTTTILIRLTDDLRDILTKEAEAMYGNPDLALRIHHIILEAAMTSEIKGAKGITIVPVNPPPDDNEETQPEPKATRKNGDALQRPERERAGKITHKWSMWVHLIHQNLDVHGKWKPFTISELHKQLRLKYTIVEGGIRQLHAAGWLEEHGSQANRTAARQYIFSREARLWLLESGNQAWLVDQGIIHEDFHAPKDINDLYIDVSSKPVTTGN